jgi:hypothetical protein
MRTSFLALVLILVAGCGLHDSWDKYAGSLTTTKPKQEDIVGSYLLTQQTITADGMTVLRGRQCRLDLLPDGSFTVTNYPDWTDAHLSSSISTVGHWRLDTIGFVHSNQSIWGIRFADTDSKLDMLSFTGKSAPYGLLMTYGDPDENKVMIFERK